VVKGRSSSREGSIVSSETILGSSVACSRRGAGEEEDEPKQSAHRVAKEEPELELTMMTRLLDDREGDVDDVVTARKRSRSQRR
jgi:hypothetical protein